MSLALGTDFIWLISLCFLERRMEVLVSGELLRLQACMSEHCKSSGEILKCNFLLMILFLRLTWCINKLAQK